MSDMTPAEPVTMTLKEAIADFESQMAEREQVFIDILPPHIDPAKFKQMAIVAVRKNPDLLRADRATLLQSIVEAAEDGLQPNGKEGIITIYKTKNKDTQQWVKACKWNPMVAGIRKRALELCNIIVDGQIVYEKDAFVWRQGDEPGIDHAPQGLGVDRGKPIGTYAIFKKDGVILHREVMDAAQVAEVRSASKVPDSLMWTKFWDQGWIKSVVRRGIKTVPSVPEFDRVVQRVDDDFDFDKPQRMSSSAAKKDPKFVNRFNDLQQEIREAESLAAVDELERENQEFIDTLPARWVQFVEDELEDARFKWTVQSFNPETLLADFDAQMLVCDDHDCLNEVWVEIEGHELTGEYEKNAAALYAKHEKRIQEAA